MQYNTEIMIYLGFGEAVATVHQVRTEVMMRTRPDLAVRVWDFRARRVTNEKCCRNESAKASPLEKSNKFITTASSISSILYSK